jgi:hypothetical protein
VKSHSQDSRSDKRSGPRLRLVREEEPAVDWANYPRIEPRVYSAYCKKAHWYWDPGFKRSNVDEWGQWRWTASGAAIHLLPSMGQG